MIFLRFDMNDSRVVYDSPNVKFMDGRGVLLEPGDEGYVQLAPGTPGYQAPVQPAPKPKRKPLGRRSALSTKTQSTHNTMPDDDSFHYNVGPAGGGRWRPRAEIQGKQTPEQHIAAIIAKCTAAGITGATAPLTEAILGFSDEETIDRAKATFSIDYPGGYRRMIPSASGSQAAPEFEGTYDNLGPDAVVYLTRKGKERFAAGFTSVLGEVRSEKTAVIARVVNVFNGSEDTYKVGKGQRVEGEDLDGMGKYHATTDPEHPEWAGTGAFYISQTDASVVQVPWEDFITKKPSELAWITPAGLTGPQTLKIVVYLNGGLRTTLWPDLAATL